MKPLPRLLAYLDAGIAAREDLGVGLAAIAAAGPAVALVARLPGGTIDQLAALTARCKANARPPEAQVCVTGRVDVALAVGTDGVIARSGDLPISTMREAIAASGHDPVSLAILASVHSAAEAEAAIADGADGVVVGAIWPTASHPGRPGAGESLLRTVVALGRPTWAIGGVTPARAARAREAGAWGVAAIGALWGPKDHFAAAVTLLEGLQPAS